MDKLIEMANAGVELYISGPYQYAKDWRLTATRTDTEGTKLEIKTADESIDVAINDLYARWLSATRGLPNHSLRQIEHTPPKNWEEAVEQTKRTLDDEIPF